VLSRMRSSEGEREREREERERGERENSVLRLKFRRILLRVLVLISHIQLPPLEFFLSSK
jgi:hypothetical protein